VREKNAGAIESPGDARATHASWFFDLARHASVPQPELKWFSGGCAFESLQENCSRSVSA